MRIGIYSNLFKDPDQTFTAKVVQALSNNGIDFYLFKNIKHIYGDSYKYFDESSYDFLDMMITVGGDGTMLNILQDCIKYDIPLLGINKGTVGFLTEIELDDISSLISIVRDGEFDIDSMNLLEVKGNGHKYYSLNDVVLYHSNALNMISVEVRINDDLLEKYACDGYVICTPTGSTAYSLSSGGPILMPGVNALCLTPICTNSLNARPIVIKDSDVVKVKLIKSYDDNALLVSDGLLVENIALWSEVEIKSSDKKARFVRLRNRNSYSRLLSKLTFHCN